MVAAHEENIDEGKLLELLEIYMELVEKQDAAIYHMSKVITRQAPELQHYKALHGFLDYSESQAAQDDARAAAEALEEYEMANNND